MISYFNFMKTWISWNLRKLWNFKISWFHFIFLWIHAWNMKFMKKNKKFMKFMKKIKNFMHEAAFFSRLLPKFKYFVNINIIINLISLKFIEISKNEDIPWNFLFYSDIFFLKKSKIKISRYLYFKYSEALIKITVNIP